MVTVRTSGDGHELVFFDGVENVCTRIAVDDPAGFSSEDPPDFPVPVDVSGELTTDRIDLASVPAITIRDSLGRVVPTGTSAESMTLDRASYLIEFSTPIKLYLAVESDLRVETDRHRLSISFGRDREITLGARAPNDRPRATVTTGGNVADVFAAVSTFGSALRTVGPDRSYPTMRGHPPLVEFGEALAIPDEARPRETDVALHIPGSYVHAAIAAPLAYYLGAHVHPDEHPRLLVGDEPVARLGDGPTFARDCRDLLHRTLFLDCLARTSSEYGIALLERERVTDRLGVDWERLRGLSHGERLREYLALDADVIGRSMPVWDQRAYVVPNSRTIETLPFLAYDLVSVRGYRPTVDRGPAPDRPVVTDGSGVDTRMPSSGHPPTHHHSRATGVGAIGGRTPVGLNRAYPAAFRNRVSRDAESDAISIVVVCNNQRMADELAFAGSVYDSRERFPVTVERAENLTRAGLAALLEDGADFFHYIGHIDEEGFECRDGMLDACSLDTVGVELFFLNACHSVTQAVGLVEGGAIGGIATHTAVVNSAAVRLGQTIAKLLIHGFPIGVAVELVRDDIVIGHKYSIIGDPKLDIAQTKSGVPYRCEVTRSDDDGYQLTVQTYLTASGRQGSATAFRLEEDTPYSLNPTRRTFAVERNELLRFLELEPVPVHLDGQLHWSTECRELLGEVGGTPAN